MENHRINVDGAGLTGTGVTRYLRLAMFALVAIESLVLTNVTTANEREAHNQRPGLLLTAEGVSEIRAHLGSVPLFDQTLARVKAEVDAEIANGIDTPIPKDFSGGYTHARHKRNFLLMPKAGALFLILEDERYARYLADMLISYEQMYGELPLHPQERSYARGKLFWQCLNDANWLLYASLGYDAIYDYLSEEQRQQLEANLFRPFADFLSKDNPQFFNRVHNHSTWGTAAVGMIGLAMRDDALVQRALYGLPDTDLDFSAKDNDGGFIFTKGQAAGFLANLDEPFSPDGYYTEGPYYQRYAMYPFLIFAQSLNNVRPELGVMQHKDNVLIKAVDALLTLTDSDGAFFPLNDAQKGMSWLNGSVVAAVDIAYDAGTRNPALLDVARQQNRVTLDDAGFAVAKALAAGQGQPFKKTSTVLSDGAGGDQGGVAVLRSSSDDLALVFKFSAQGLSHGHYDKLSYSLYQPGSDVLQDYGMVRFVNIGQKGGGNYLPENTTWAKQTVAHNTVVQDGVSHFEGRYDLGAKHHSELAFTALTNTAAQVVSAFDDHAYPGTRMHRTLIMMQDTEAQRPLLIDLFRLSSDNTHTYDLPFWFTGQHLSASADIDTEMSATSIGKQAGYQHLTLEGRIEHQSNSAQFQWLVDETFYTLTSSVAAGDEWLFARLGANDADFNLRRDTALIQRRKGEAETVFANVIEPHGRYSRVTELTEQPFGRVKSVQVVHNDDQYTAVVIDVDDHELLVIIANADFSKDASHALQLDGQTQRWQGPFFYRQQYEIPTIHD